MKDKYFWFKYREKWASGYGEWEYKFLPFIKDITTVELIIEFLDEKSMQWNYSDKFRGYDYELLQEKDVPDKVINEMGKTYQRNSDSYLRLRNFIYEIEDRRQDEKIIKDNEDDTN